MIKKGLILLFCAVLFHNGAIAAQPQTDTDKPEPENASSINLLQNEPDSDSVKIDVSESAASGGSIESTMVLRERLFQRLREEHVHRNYEDYPEDIVMSMSNAEIEAVFQGDGEDEDLADYTDVTEDVDDEQQEESDEPEGDADAEAAVEENESEDNETNKDVDEETEDETDKETDDEGLLGILYEHKEEAAALLLGGTTAGVAAKIWKSKREEELEDEEDDEDDPDDNDDNDYDEDDYEEHEDYEENVESHDVEDEPDDINSDSPSNDDFGNTSTEGVGMELPVELIHPMTAAGAVKTDVSNGDSGKPDAKTETAKTDSTNAGNVKSDDTTDKTEKTDTAKTDDAKNKTEKTDASKNDNASKDSSSVGSGNIGAVGSGYVEPAAVYQVLRGLGFNKVAACGIMGNIMQESSFNTFANNGDDYMGLCQWDTDGRWPALVQYANSNGMDPYDAATQLRFMSHEAETSWRSEWCAINEVNQCSTPEEAAVYWQRYYEGAAGQEDYERGDYAREFYETFV